MKLFAPIVLFLAGSASAAPLQWQNLSTEVPVFLTQDLALKGRGGEAIAVKKDSAYTLDSIMPLPGISVVDYIFIPKNCPNPDLESELDIVLPTENAPTSGAEVGVALLKNCQLEVMAEAKDLGKPSFFRK